MERFFSAPLLLLFGASELYDRRVLSIADHTVRGCQRNVTYLSFVGIRRFICSVS